ncbi:sodium:solute symporter family protein [Natronogracilivirga saccharolytica]|uniref:Sodium:solute symporter family protein n=1 Tax=Natronogracilivirga saccharolytica TaxID=2812953 RepID=A0A8J7RNK7_9BACT|nr:sodium:solute symporter family protein [Natronogracilivirga saccharolytica]MBP3193323.1 sodium:solute symporter family protein [Natronogracilivirga saccharolytica]
MQTSQLIIAGLYFAVIFGVGMYATRYVKNATDFLLAGRRLGLVLATAALAATHFGGGFVVGTGEWGYMYGLTGMAYAVSVGLALLLLAVVAARRMRRLGLVTVPDYLEHRYHSPVARFLGALLSLIAIIGILGAQVWASQGALSILGIDPVVAATIATLLFIIYTAASGLWGVTLTDAVQLAIIFIGIPLAAALGLQSAGGFDGIREGLAAAEPDVSVDGYFHPAGAGGMWIVAALLPAILYTLIGQDFYQRLFAARDEKIAVRAAALAGCILILYAVFPTVAGMAARGVFGEGIDPAQAIPLLVAEVLPAWIGAIVVAAIIGAIMSTADSLLVAGTSHLTHDMYARIGPADRTGDTRRMLLISRIGTVVIGLLALFLALYIQRIIDLLLLSYTMYAAGVFVPVVMGLYWPRGTAAGAVSAIIGGSLTGLAAAQGWLALPYLSEWPPIVLGALVSLIVYVAVSLMTEAPDRRDPAEQG